MPSTAEALACLNCGAPIPAGDWNREHAFCPACRAPHQALVFPEFFSHPRESSAGELVVEAGEASCFYHPEKRAVAPCDQCGRFLCGLCQVEFKGQNWCPGCIESRRQKGKLADLDAGRPLYDNMSLALALLPLLLIWPTIPTAPMTLYMVVRYWRAPSSILPRTRIRFVIAAAVAFVQIAAWIWLVVFLIYKR